MQSQNKKTFATLITVAVGIIAVVLVGSIRVSATHVTIDTNLSVTPNIISFQTVFPEEVLFRQLSINLSSAFLRTATLDDVEYQILEQVKPRQDADRAYCQAHPTDSARCYPSLCPYL